MIYSLQKMVENGIWNEIFEILPPSNETIRSLSCVSSGNFATRLAILLTNYDETERELTLNSLRLSNEEKKKVLRLCKIKGFPTPNENPLKLARHFLHLYDNILYDALEVLSVYLSNDNFESFRTIVLSEKKQKRPLRISDLAIRGDDLIPLCNKNHALVGKTLNSLLTIVIDAPELNEKDTLISKAKELIKEFK